MLIPLPQQQFLWLGQGDKDYQSLARDAAQTVRQMAEGEAVRQAISNNPWMIAGYVLGALIGLQILIALFALMMTALFR